MTTTNCSECQKPLGSNAECVECLQHLVKEGAGKLTEDEARKAHGEGEDWMVGRGKSAPEELIGKFKLLWNFVGDFFRGDPCAKFPWGTVAVAAFGMAYCIWPIDLIPDFIPVAGWLDDLGVIAIVWKSLSSTLEEYRKCKEGQ